MGDTVGKKWVGKHIIVKENSPSYAGRTGIVVDRSVLPHRSDDTYKLNEVFVRINTNDLVIQSTASASYFCIAPKFVKVIPKRINIHHHARAIKRIALRHGRQYMTLEDIEEHKSRKRKR